VSTRPRAALTSILLGAIALSACGTLNPEAGVSPPAVLSPTTTSAASPSSPTPSPVAVSATLRFAALTASANPGDWNRVVIAGLDGKTYNEASFQPLPSPDTGCGGAALLPPSAYVVNSRVYFADGTGTIRSLGIAGPPSTVAQFPLTSTQQLMSFAISPDGKQVLATIATLPPATIGTAICRGEPTTGDSNYYYDLYAGVAGGSSHLVSHQTFPAHSFPNHLALPAVELDGWSADGPFGSKPSEFAAGGPWVPSCIGLCRWVLPGTSNVWFVDPLTGAPTRVADGDCRVVDILASGSYLCQDNNQRFYVKASTGAWLWNIGCTLEACLDNGGLLAPDATHVAALQPHNQDPGHTTMVLGQDQSRVQLGDQFVPDGWFDSATVAVDNGFNLQYVSLSAPTQAREIGIIGAFVGTLAS
jgi:hypothetical protein